MSELTPRIVGSEMEWGALVDRPPVDTTSNPLSVAHPIEQLISYLPRSLSKVETYLSNGARIYPDLSHIEYATPEHLSFRGMVAAEIAGERIVHQTFLNAQEDERIQDFRLNKRVIDDRQNTWGYHISLSSDVRKLSIDERFVGIMGLHLATQNLLCGAGVALPGHDKGGARFAIAQKVLNLSKDKASLAHGLEKPLVNTRDEALATEYLWKRIHITSMDANMSPWATWMKVGMASLMLRLIEDGYSIPELDTVKPLHAVARNIALDSSLARPVMLSSGNTILPIEIARYFQESACELAARKQLPAEEKLVLAEWERALDDLEKKPELLIDRVEWIAKKAILEAYMDRHGLSWGRQEVRHKDRQWDEISPRGIGLKLRDGSWAKHMPPEAQIARAEVKPPKNTRALVRGNFIRDIRRNYQTPTNVSVSWSSIEVGEKVIELGDPYKSYNPAVQKLAAGQSRTWRRRRY